MPSAADAASSADLPGKLRWYYTRLFPLQAFTRWLRYGSDTNLSRREISFTLSGDIYLRWKSFSTAEELLEALKSLAPIKMDIGAIYNFPPADKQSVSAVLTPQQKEVVFDIDMTDYEEVIGDLGGGTPTEVTDRNWRYMATAVKVIDAALREDFGFQHILWVYSGRRGIHCWVGDARARSLSNEQRSAIADYLYLRFEGRDNIGRRQTQVTNPIHPSLARAKKIACDATFHEFVLGDQGLLNTEERVKNMVELIPQKNIALEIRSKLDKMGPGRGTEKWERLEKEVNRVSRSGDWGLRSMIDYIILKYTYPRLDANVSREINHLLKAPFCVHPKTGRVCVPFRAAEVDDFVPGERAPCLDGLLKEIESGDGVMMKRLKEGIKVFEEFVEGVEGETRSIARRQRLDEMDKRGAVQFVNV